MKESKAYYIIDAPTTFSNSPSAAFEGVPNGWNGDNRFLTAQNMSEPERYIKMSGNGKEYSSINRTFRRETDGILTSELLVTAMGEDKSIYISFEAENGERVLTVSTDNGEWGLFGETMNSSKVSFSDVETGLYSVVVNLDLDKGTANAIINNTPVCEVEIKKIGVCRLALGVNKGKVGTVKLEYIKMWKNYALNEHFLIPKASEGQTPCNWEITGDFTLQAMPSCKGLEIYSMRSKTQCGKVSSAKKSFEPLSGLFSLEAYILLPKKLDGARISFTNGGKEVFGFETRDGNICYMGKAVNNYIENIWQCLCIDADTESKTATVKVNGKSKLKVNFDSDKIDGVKISFCPDKDGEIWFDDVKAYILDNPSDYPEKPIVADVSPYHIGTNVCWLWRDFNCGEGWDSVSSFPEFEPYLGYYDEGSREYADWEIKYLIENGINFIHACWYSPNANDDVPIKNEDYSFAALHDGYFNARYSDLEPFCIMWENSGNRDIGGFEKFKNRLWNYWVEYYFKDPRYLRLDNKAVLTVFMPENMEKTFGSAEDVKKAVEFMNEDIKKYGYDGIILLSDNEFYKSYDYLNSLGFDGSYAYQWGKQGSSGEFQKEKNHLFRERAKMGKSHHIPTVGVGFNLVGRGFVRSDFISKAEHLEVCRDIKKILSESHTGTWRDTTLMVSTWNEYSEGHCVAPAGSVGFDLLENVRETFSANPQSDIHASVKPTKAQKERITHLYPPAHSPLRRLLIEKSEFETIDGKEVFTLVKRFDMKNSADAKSWVNLNAVTDLCQKKGTLCGTSNLTDPGIVNKKPLNISADDVSVIRIRMKTNASPDDEIDVFYATESSPQFSTDKWINKKLVTGDSFTDYYFCTETSALWQGKITSLRIDPISDKGSFEIACIDFLKLQGITGVYIGKTRAAFPCILKKTPDGDYKAPIERQFLILLGLYYEYDRFTDNGVLTLKDRNDNIYKINVGSDECLVNGKQAPLGFAPSMWDGLPVMNICAFLRLLGRKYKLSNNGIYIEE